MSGPDAPDWNAIKLKIILWEERLRARSQEFQILDERFRDLEGRLKAFKARLALGTDVMAAPDAPKPPPARAEPPARPTSIAKPPQLPPRAVNPRTSPTAPRLARPASSPASQ